MATGYREGMAAIAQRGLMQTQESMLETNKKSNSLYIGIPKEISFPRMQDCAYAFIGCLIDQ
jgi:alanine dehydrogenase